MSLDPDDLAGVVDLFGALTPGELDRALAELAYRRDESVGDVSAAVTRACESYHLVAFDDETVVGGSDDATLLTVGPVAFPTLPAGAEDLPHILDIDVRPVDRESLARSVEAELRADAARAVGAEDRERIELLLDVSYDLEAWAPVDVSSIRDRLDSALVEVSEAGDGETEG